MWGCALIQCSLSDSCWAPEALRSSAFVPSLRSCPGRGQRGCGVCAGAAIWGTEEQNSLICCACRQLRKLTFQKHAKASNHPQESPERSRGAEGRAGPCARGSTGAVPVTGDAPQAPGRIPEECWARHRGRNRCGNAKMCDALSGEEPEPPHRAAGLRSLGHAWSGGWGQPLCGTAQGQPQHSASGSRWFFPLPG